ncbi:spore gernimation protein XB [Bacillus badius]|nr:spore gernimation protein XB [Bacillus badius]OCS84854.1 spore gernimation protein XB [Bacillus badius]OVE46213.1 spore gernimation protein XB [Bacillus badius]
MVLINKSDTITPIQLILLSMTAIGLKNHVFAISPLVEVSGRDAWLAVLFTLLLVLLWIPLLLYIQNQTNRQPLLVWLSSIIGSVPTKIIAITFICYLILMSSISLRETTIWTNIAYLPTTPPVILAIAFLGACCLMVKANLRALNMLNVFLLFFIVILGFFVAITNIQHKNFYLLLPVLENGYKPVFDGMIYQASGMTELFVFLLLQHKVNVPLRFRHFFAAALILTLLTMGPLIGAIIEFGPTEASLQRFPPFEQWTLVSIGRFIEHLDFLSIYQWLAGVFIRLCLLLLLIKDLFTLNTTINWILFFTSTAIVILTLSPIADFQFHYLLKTYLLPATFWFFFSSSIFLTIVAVIQSIRKRRAA